MSHLVGQIAKEIVVDMKQQKYNTTICKLVMKYGQDHYGYSKPSRMIDVKEHVKMMCMEDVRMIDDN